jgi:ubiquinone/menaquinone biosynthesis C-methylase UbiE
MTTDDNSADIWNAAAPNFDNEPDHGLRDPVVRQAWTTLLASFLPTSPVNVLDIGCGTGSLSVLMAGLSHQVTGIDFSPAMIELAQAKAAAQDYQIEFHVMDATSPYLTASQFDVIICRHVLWALPDISQVLERWLRLLRKPGRLVLIEGFWHTGAGLHAEQIRMALPSSLANITVHPLSQQADLWGDPVNDERYAIVADTNC